MLSSHMRRGLLSLRLSTARHIACSAVRRIGEGADGARPESTNSSTGIETTQNTSSGGDAEQDDFATFFDTISTTQSGSESMSFARMLRNSKLMQLGGVEGRLVVGKIVNRVVDDLYIDFGFKFNAVCKAPAQNGEVYMPGAHVLLRLHDLELSERFLGSKNDLTLLEADATLIRLLTGRRQKADAKEVVGGKQSESKKETEAKEENREISS